VGGVGWWLLLIPVAAAQEAVVALLAADFDRRQSQKFRYQEHGLYFAAVPKPEMSKGEAVVVY
jgi:hypothetical protein